MTVPRLWMGRKGIDFVCNISPQGIDASTATADQLLLSLSSSIPQIAMSGVVSGSATVPHTLGFIPFVLPNLISTKLGIGYVRPYDNGWSPWTNTLATPTASSVVFSQSGSALNVNYYSINRPMPF